MPWCGACEQKLSAPFKCPTYAPPSLSSLTLIGALETYVKIPNQTDWVCFATWKATPDSSLEWFMKWLSALKLTPWCIAKLTHCIPFTHRVKLHDIYVCKLCNWCPRHANWYTASRASSLQSFRSVRKRKSFPLLGKGKSFPLPEWFRKVEEISARRVANWYMSSKNRLERMHILLCIKIFPVLMSTVCRASAVYCKCYWKHCF